VSKLDIIRFPEGVLIVPLAEITGIAAADLVHDFLSMFLAKEPPKQSSHRKPKIAALMPQNWFL
jgi:hypothetical protein